MSTQHNNININSVDSSLSYTAEQCNYLNNVYKCHPNLLQYFITIYILACQKWVRVKT